MRRSFTMILTAGALLATLAGCAGKVADPDSPAIAASGSIAPLLPSIVPDSPHALVDAFVEAMNRRDVVHYGRLFTDDFEFAFSVGERAGYAFPGRELTRAIELESAANLFANGTPDLAPARQVALTFDPFLFVEPDPRPGKTFPWHQEVRKVYRLKVDVSDDWGFYTEGELHFFLVRGDSAAIPPDLAARGFAPDSTRWWIERWEDGPFYDPAPAARAPGVNPAGLYTTWGALKWFYLGTPAIPDTI